MPRTILAIVGLPGSGKTEIISYLLEKYKWPKVYFGEVTFDEMKVRGLDINEQNERFVREDLRAKFGQLYYAEKIIEKIKNLGKDVNILVESLYSWDEYLLLKKEFGNEFKVMAMYAPPEIRYVRLTNRPIRPLTLEEAQGRDYSQIKNLSQAGPIAMADFTILNTGTIDELKENVDKIVEKI